MDGQADKNHPVGDRPVVDARGLRCPLPALRLARAVREGGPGRYRLLADDPAASTDIPALCAERGWVLPAAAEGWFEVDAS
jgi:tRNA 2-thiouridine synthesizing protein A